MALDLTSPNQDQLPDTSCPKCGTALTDPRGLGWCMKCGFCRSLEEEKNILANFEKGSKGNPHFQGLKATSLLIAGFPRWVWIAFMGVILFGAFSFLQSMILPPDSFERALWSTCQIVVGFFVMLFGQMWAVIQIAPRDDRISFRDAIFPFRLYPMVLKRLPDLQMTLWLASWGMTLILSAVFIIGGLPHWLTYLPGQVNNPRVVDTKK